MDGTRKMLLFLLAIISADLGARYGLSSLTEAHPGTNSGYGIMGTTDEEDSEKWAKEQEKAFKKLESDWFRRRFSGSGSGNGAEESGSGSSGEKHNNSFRTLKNQLRSSEFKLGHKRQMGYGVQSYTETDTNRIINQAVNETILEKATHPPPMPPTMPKTTSPVEPYTYLPNITIPPYKVTVNEVSESTTVQGPGTASSSVNLKGVGGQNLSIKTSQKGPKGDTSNGTYTASAPKPGMPISVHLGNNISSIDLVGVKTPGSKANDQPSSYNYYSGNVGGQVQEQQSPNLNSTVSDLPQTAQFQPTVTPMTAASSDDAGISNSYNSQFQMEKSNLDTQSANAFTAISNEQVERYPSNLSISMSSNMNPSAAVASSVEASNGNITNNQSETAANYYLGGVQIQNSSPASGQQSQTQQGSVPTRSTLPWQKATLTSDQSAGQNPTLSVSLTQRADYTSAIQDSRSSPFEIQKTENQKPSFSVQFQTEVANPTNSHGLNIRPVQIGRLVTHDEGGRLVINSSSTYEIGQNVNNPGSSYQGMPASSAAESSTQNTQQQASDTSGLLNNTTFTGLNSPTNKPNTVETGRYSYQENQSTRPTNYAAPTKAASPTPPSWLPTYSLLKNMKPGALASKTQPDQATAEASINITEVIFPKGGYKGLPVMVMQPPSGENKPTVKPAPIPLIDQGTFNESSVGQFQLPNVGTTQVPVNSPTQVSTQGPTEGPTQVPTQGPTQVQTQVPTQAFTTQPLQAQTQGPKPTSGASTSMFAIGSNPTVVGTVNPTAAISTATGKLPTSSLADEEMATGNMAGSIPNIQESGTISLPGSQTDELTAKEMEKMMHVEENEEKLIGNESVMSNENPKTEENAVENKEEDATLLRPTQAQISQVPTADPYKGVKDALLSVDIAQLRPGELLSLRLPNSETSDIFQVKDIKSNDDVSAYSSDPDFEAGNANLRGSRDKTHILYAIIEKVKHNKNYRNAMKALFSTGDRRSWKSSKKGKSKTIELPQRAILRSYSKDELDKKNEEELLKLFQENIGSMNVAGSHSLKTMKTPDIEFDQVHHDVEKYVKKDNNDANTLRAKLLSVEAKMHRLHRKSNVGGFKRSDIHGHRHYHKKILTDEKDSKKTEGTFEVTLNVSGKKKKPTEDKAKQDDESEKTENKFKPGSKLKFTGTFTDGKGEGEEEDRIKTISSLQTEQTSGGLKPKEQTGNVIIEDEKGNVLYKGPVDIAALNQTVVKNGENDTGFQLQNVGYRVDPSATSEENVVLKQGLQQVMPKKRSEWFLHRRHRTGMHKSHLIRRYSRSIELEMPKDVPATKKTDGVFKLTLQVSGKQKEAASAETSKEGKDDVNMNDASHQLFHDEKQLTFSGTFTDGKDSKDENKRKEEKEKEEEEEEEEKNEKEKKKKKKKKVQKEEEEQQEEEEEAQEEGKKKKRKKGKKGEENEEEEEEKEEEENSRKKKKGEKKKKEEEVEEKSKDKKKGENEEKSPGKEVANENRQGNTTQVAQLKANTTNVIIEDGKGNILYKGPVDIAALNKTVSTKNGTYSGFHLENAGYKVEESSDPQEIELLNDGLQHAIRPRGAVNPMQFLEPKRRRRSLLEDSQPSKKTDGTFSLTLALKDDKKKKENEKSKEAKKDEHDNEDKPDKDGHHSDVQQNIDNLNKATKKLVNSRKFEDSNTTSETAKKVPPHVIIEDEHGKPLYQGPVDITELNKSVASKGGSIGYELQKTGYQLVKDPNQEQTAQSDATSSQNNVVNQEAYEDSNDNSNPAAKVDEIKQQTDDRNTNVIKISSSTNDGSPYIQEEQNITVDVTNDDGSQGQSMPALGKEEQSMNAFQMGPNIEPYDVSINKQDQDVVSEIPPDASKKLHNGDQKTSQLESNTLPSLDKENISQQYSVNNGEKQLVQDQMDKNENHKVTKKEKNSNSKVKSHDDKQQTSLTSTSFVDTTNSKLIRIITPKPKLSSKNPKSKETSKENGQRESAKMPSDEALHDLQTNTANSQKGIELNKENSYNVMLTDARNGPSSIGGQILTPAPITEEHKIPEMKEGSTNEKAMANAMPNDSHGQVGVSDSSALANENIPSQDGQTNPELKKVAFLSQETLANMLAHAQMNEASMKKPEPAPQLLLAGQNINNNAKPFPKKYQVLKLTGNKLKELLANSANTANPAKFESHANLGKEQQKPVFAAALQDNPRAENKANGRNGNEQPITLILSGPYLDQLEPNNVSTSLPTNTLSNDQMKTGSQVANSKPLNITQTNVNDVNAMLNPEGRNITTMLPNEMFSNDDDKILIGGGGKTVRPAPAAEGVFKSQEDASGLNVLLKTPVIQNPAFLVQSKNASPLQISSKSPLGMEASPTISFLSGSGQRVDCHALPAGSSLTLLNCGPNGQRIVGPTVSTLTKEQAASMLNLPMNDMPIQNPIQQHQLTEPDVTQNILGAPDIRMNDEPQPASTQQMHDSTKQEYGYGTVTDPALYHKMSTDIKDYLDKEMNDEKNMIQNLLVGSSSPRASLPSQNNNDNTDDALPFGFEYIPSASENNLYNMEAENQQMYQGFPNEYINTLSNPGMLRRPHKMSPSRSRHRNTRRSQIRKAYQRPGPWKRKKSSRKKFRGSPVPHWSFRGIFPAPLPLVIRPLYPQPWLLTKRCCSDCKNDDKEKSKCSKTSSSPSKNENLPTPAPSSMSEWEYLGRVLCSCPCCIECVDW